MLDTATALKRTPFYPRHVAAGAKMVPFAGHEMPIQYEGILTEHRTVRAGVGVFDVSHMGEIRLRGPGAIAYANRLVTNEVGASLAEGKVVYTPMCLEHGGIVDDLLVYAFGAERYLVVNAANFDKDLAWIRSHAPADVEVIDEHAATAQLAVQGPFAEEVIARIYGDRVRELAFYEAYVADEGGSPTIVSRTGYTGEDGFELYMPVARALDVWDRVFAAGETQGIRPIGLGATASTETTSTKRRIRSRRGSPGRFVSRSPISSAATPSCGPRRRASSADSSASCSTASGSLDPASRSSRRESAWGPSPAARWGSASAARSPWPISKATPRA
jgi:glycine cleavage system aminomethyltransferase T